MNEASTHEFELRIDSEHPSLPGHFPGRPIVPGVVLLDTVIAGAERWLGRSLQVKALPQTKFVQPLLPEQPANVSLALARDELKFEITSEQGRIAQGALKLDVGSNA